MTTRSFLSDVARQFRSLDQSGEQIAVQEGFPREFADKRYSVFDAGGGLNNHFQGVQRVGKHLLVSGSFPFKSPKPRADLLVFRLGSRSADPGPWGSNLVRSRTPANADCLVNYFCIDNEYWHPGGFTLLDGHAVVPIENGEAGQSKIVFLDMANPEQPKRVAGWDIDRPKHKAGACAATFLPDERILIAVWSDSDKPVDPDVKPPLHLDLYVSTKPNDKSQFKEVARFLPAEGTDFHKKFQCFDFVWQKDASGAEKLFLIAFENTHAAQPHPTQLGRNVAYLFDVATSKLPFVPKPDGTPHTLSAGFMTLIEEHPFKDNDQRWYNMDAGACAYVDSNQHLIVYSVFHFLNRLKGSRDLALKCLEFRSTDFGDPITLIEDAWVEIYEKKRLEGRRLAILGPWDASIEDTKRIFVEGKTFREGRSARQQIPDGVAFVLYPEAGFRGNKCLGLKGTGSVKVYDPPAGQFGPEFGSCRFVPLSVAQDIPGITLI